MTEAPPVPVPGVLDRRPARTVRTTYKVTLTPAEDRTIIAIHETHWVGGHPTPRLLGQFAVQGAARADWELGGVAVLPLILSAVAAYLEA